MPKQGWDEIFTGCRWGKIRKDVFRASGRVGEGCGAGKWYGCRGDDIATELHPAGAGACIGVIETRIRTR